jgi:SprT-like family
MQDVKTSPTIDLYNQIQWLTTHFNRALFEARLPTVIITLQRSAHTSGHLSKSRWRHISGESVSELALNPTYFSNRPLLALCQTIVHELCHLWQQINGSASRPGYHNNEWAEKMEQIGLMPSSTGRPGGAKTGQKMADYPIQGGAFLLACEELTSAQFDLKWVDQGDISTTAYRSLQDADFGLAGQVSDRLLTPLCDLFPNITAPYVRLTNSKKIKSRYRCPTCYAKAWGKEGLRIICGDCKNDFEELKAHISNKKI